MPHQFENQPPSRAQRVTLDEAQAMIRLWQERRDVDFSDLPAVADIAEGLNISNAEAEQLLAEVRAQRQETERLRAQEQQQREAAEELRALREQQLEALITERVEPRRQSVEMSRQQTETRRRQAAFRCRRLEEQTEEQQRAELHESLPALEGEFLQERERQRRLLFGWPGHSHGAL